MLPSTLLLSSDLHLHQPASSSLRAGYPSTQYSLILLSSRLIFPPPAPREPAAVSPRIYSSAPSIRFPNFLRRRRPGIAWWLTSTTFKYLSPCPTKRLELYNKMTAPLGGLCSLRVVITELDWTTGSPGAGGWRI